MLLLPDRHVDVDAVYQTLSTSSILDGIVLTMLMKFDEVRVKSHGLSQALLLISFFFQNLFNPRTLSKRPRNFP